MAEDKTADRAPEAVDRPGLPPTAAAALALLTATLAAIGQHLLADPGSRGMGVAAYLLAVAAFFWLVDLRRSEDDDPLSSRVLGEPWREPGAGWRALLRQRPWRDTEVSGARLRGAVRRAPVRSTLILLAFLLSATVVTDLHLRADGYLPYWDTLTLWLLSVGMFVASFVQPQTFASRAWWKHQLATHRQPLRDAGLLLVFALILRVPGLDRWPDVLTGDEGIIGNHALGFEDGRGTLFGTAWAYSDLMFLIRAPLVIALGGIGPLRLPDAVIGSFAAPAAYLAGRQLFGRRVGLMAGVLVAALHLHVHVSRIALSHGMDGALAAIVFFTFMRGLQRRDARWMALAGVGLGLSQYGYFGGRVLGLVVAAFVIVQVLSQPMFVWRMRRPIAVALGAAIVTAAPMIRLAIERPGDYLSRANKEGIVQSGVLAKQMADTGHLAWRVLLAQLRDGWLGITVYPADQFYNASVPMFNMALAVLLVLGVAYALGRIGDRRNQLLVLHVVLSLLMLALAKYPNAAAYRVAGMVPTAAILAAAALRLLVEGATRDLRLPARVPALIMAGVIGVVAAYDVAYYFLDHLPNCRYADPGTAAASVASSYIAPLPDDFNVIALTPPYVNLETYPSTVYLSRREVLPLPTPRAHGDTKRWPPIGQGLTDKILTLPEGAEGVPDVVRSARPAVILAVPERLEELEAIRAALPGGRSEQLTRCGEVLFEVYVLH